VIIASITAVPNIIVHIIDAVLRILLFCDDNMPDGFSLFFLFAINCLSSWPLLLSSRRVVC